MLLWRVVVQVSLDEWGAVDEQGRFVIGPPNRSEAEGSAADCYTGNDRVRSIFAGRDRFEFIDLVHEPAAFLVFLEKLASLGIAGPLHSVNVNGDRFR